MFENLSERLQGILKRIRGQGRLNEKNIQEALREVRLALLEADVNFKVVKSFIESVSEKAIGETVLKSLTPGQQVVKIVHQELIRLLGEKSERLELAPVPPTIFMLAGLQGSGKTTSCGKLAKFYKDEGKKPLLVAADIYRPAAIQQLITIGKQVGVDVYSRPDLNPPLICKTAIEKAKNEGRDVIIIDTAGRLHIDEKLMDELRQIKSLIHPHEILLVADAMSGQDAVNVAKAFNDALNITGVILTKMDGDARGGAALSIKAVTGKPIKLIGVGEKLDYLEPFHPDRIASRILGMGDVLTLVEKAQRTIDQEEAKKLEEKLRKETFTLDDFLAQLKQIRKMGPLEDLLSMIPGMGNMKMLKDFKIDEKDLKRIEAIISSMTKKERLDYTIINASRRRRIAKGSGTSTVEVAQVIKQFAQMKKMMRMLKEVPRKGFRMKMGRFPF